MSHLIIVLLTISQQICDGRVLYKLEGEDAKLNFPYPCDSTEVTLQHGNAHPFYRSSNPGHISLPSRYKLRNHTDSISDECFLNLTINPVSRDDEGTFILTAYKDGVILPDYPIIGLRVDYLPGKASCESNNEYVDGEWVKLYCQASMGTVPGQIVCYQDDMRLPSLTSPEVNGGTLSQTMLARLANNLVYCCSSSYTFTPDQTKPICDCHDYAWDPIKNRALLNITNPCVQQVSHSNTKVYKNVTTAPDSQAATTLPTQWTGKKKSSQHQFSLSWIHIVICIGTCTLVAILITIIAVLYCRKVKEELLSAKLHIHVDDAAEAEEQQSLKQETPRSSQGGMSH